MVRNIVILSFVLLVWVGKATGQQVIAEGYIVEDSLLIAKPFNYSLRVSYPERLDVVFPDSTYDFSPFEFVGLKTFPTYRDSTGLVDSAIYLLRTFEVDAVQGIALPVYIMKEDDSIRVPSSYDSAYLIQLVQEPVENQQLKSSTAYVEVNEAFNYPYFILALIILLVLAVLVFVIFGKRIRQYFRLKKMKKRYMVFADQMGDGLAAISREKNIKSIEQVLILWKNYLSDIEQQPYAKLTTRELEQFDFKIGTIAALKQIDRTIYREKYDEEVIKSLQTLEDVALERYQLAINKIKDA